VALDRTRLTITKLEAARRQLNTAIMLWFADGDPVSIHTLAYAAYEIIHAVSKQRLRTQKLLFDAAHVKEEYRPEVNKLLKKHANFFKHAKTDAENQIEFPPVVSLLFLIFSILGIGSMRLAKTNAETDFMLWQTIHEPKFLTDEGRKVYVDTIGVDQLTHLKSLSKEEFLEACNRARKFVGLSD